MSSVREHGGGSKTIHIGLEERSYHLKFHNTTRKPTSI